MSTPIFDALLAESDETTRALVWDAVSNPAFDIARFMDEMNRLGRAYAQVAVEPEPELQHPGTWLPGDQIVDTDGDLWTKEPGGRWTWHRPDGLAVKGFAGDYSAEAELAAPEEGARITQLVPRTNGGE